MPYKSKKDRAKYMRDYRRRKAQEQSDFAKELQKMNAQIARDLAQKFPGMFPSQHKAKKGKKK